jgi:DNA-binding response OmpR family regulator
MTKPYALIIEDDPKLGVIFQTALQQAGFDADVDQTGKHFSARLADRTPVLIILDIHLPYASGIEILEQIRSHEGWAKAVVIVATADLFLSKTIEGKADYALIKPVSVARIMKIVASRWPEQTSHDLPPGEERSHE